MLNFGDVEAFKQHECLKVSKINCDLFSPVTLGSHVLASHLQGASYLQNLQKPSIHLGSQLGKSGPQLLSVLLGFQLYNLYIKCQWKTASS